MERSSNKRRSKMPQATREMVGEIDDRGELLKVADAALTRLEGRVGVGQKGKQKKMPPATREMALGILAIGVGLRHSPTFISTDEEIREKREAAERRRLRSLQRAG